jgi:hypothetical protein
MVVVGVTVRDLMVVAVIVAVALALGVAIALRALLRRERRRRDMLRRGSWPVTFPGPNGPLEPSGDREPRQPSSPNRVASSGLRASETSDR